MFSGNGSESHGAPLLEGVAAVAINLAELGTHDVLQVPLEETVLMVDISVNRVFSGKRLTKEEWVVRLGQEEEGEVSLVYFVATAAVMISIANEADQRAIGGDVGGSAVRVGGLDASL